MRFKVKDENFFLLPSNNHMLHIATIAYGLREFIVMLDMNQRNIYIEEVVLESKDFSQDVWANFKFIDDDILAFDLAKFCESKKITDMQRVEEYMIAQQDRIWMTR